MKPRKLFGKDAQYLASVPPQGIVLPRAGSVRATRLIQWKLLQPHRCAEGVTVTLTRAGRAQIQQEPQHG